MIIPEDKLVTFLQLVYKVYSYDFLHYSYSVLKRRIETHSIKLMVNSFEEYEKLVLNDKKIFDEMFSYFSINVTEFFREPEQLKLFREHLVPYLNSYSHIKIWCAGCSSGESPYSMAILLQEEGVLHKTQIYATDFNNRVLAKAKNGLFEFEHYNVSLNNYKQSGGKFSFDDYFIKQGKYKKIKRYIQEHIVFFNHNLVTDNVMNEFQLIICKNVIIYFDKELKQKVIQLFDDSLECNGFLILGSSESLPSKFESKFKKYIPKSKVYHKKCI